MICKKPPKIIRNKKSNYILNFCRLSEVLLSHGGVCREYYETKISFSGGDVVSLLLKV